VSALRHVYAGKTLLVTGSTGFLAKALVAKVLRDLPDTRLVLLIRERTRPGGDVVPASDRLRREVLGSSAFRRLRSELGDGFERTLAARVRAIQGDLTRPGLGLSPDDAQVLAAVDVVVNSAATVVFDEELDKALAINARSVLQLLAAARGARNAPLLHVSTAYVCGRSTGVVPERPPDPSRVVDDDLRGLEKGTLDLDAELRHLDARCEEARARLGADRAQLKERLIEIGMEEARRRGWNDTYTYTKSLGERLLVRERGGVPACILRPAIIESAVQEPEPGWIDGLRMADPIFAAFGRGVLRDFPADPDSLIDFIPVDHVVNAALAALGDLLARSVAGVRQDGVPVHHVATSSANPLGFLELFELTRDYFLDNPMRGRDGRPVTPPLWGFVDEGRFTRRMGRRLRAVDAAATALKVLPARVTGQGRQALARTKGQLERILYYVRIYRPYCTFPAQFDTSRTEALFRSLSPQDQALFPFDPRSIDWASYIQDVHIPGLRRNVLREQVPEPMAHGTPAAGPAPPEEGAPSVRTLVTLIEATASAHGARPALRIRRDGALRTMTHRELLESALGGAARLQGLGVKPGDRVLLVSENRPEWVASYFAILAAGAIAVPLDAGSDAARIEAVGRVTDARVALFSPRCRDAFGAGNGHDPGFLVALVTDLAAQPLAAPAARGMDLPVPVTPEQAASILFTSGTTLEPKGVVLPHASFLANLDSIVEVLQPTCEDRIVSVLPLHHAFEFTAGLLAPLSVGASITYLETLSSQAIVETLRETRATHLLGVPRLFELVLAGLSRQLDETGGGAGAVLGALRGTSRAFSAVGVNASRTLLAPLHARFGGCLRALISGGAALDPKVHDGFRALGFPIVEGYGLTECAPVVTVNPLDDSRAGTVGRPLPGVEVRIHRPGADGVGEILVRGANLMAGYYKDPESTSRVVRDGWFHTGDLGRLDDDGYLRITGRLKDLIVTGAGKNVYPDEVEATLHDVAHVKEACVVGARARGGAGEEVHLVVVLAADAPPGAKDAVTREVTARMQALPPHQRVQRIHFWDEDLPKTALQKVKRGQVQARLQGDVAPAGATATTAPLDDHPAVRDVLQLLARLARVPASSLRRDQALSFDLGVDSLMRVELVAAIEARTGKTVPDETVQDVATVDDLCVLVRSLAGAVPAAAGAARRGNGPDVAAMALRAVDGTGRLLSRAAAPLVRGSWPAFYGAYLRLRVRGREHVPVGGAYILAANHQSHLDAGAILTALGPEASRVRVVAARDYFFSTPWRSSFFSQLMNAIPFDRHGDWEQGMEACKAALGAGHPLLIFPEGTRSPDGRLQPFKAGIGILALDAGVPIVPARIDGTHQALPKGRRIPRPFGVTVTFGAPLDARQLVERTTLLSYERYRHVAEAVRQDIVALGHQKHATTP
jgi:long-chain acyl-CoA synthetase